MGYDDEQSKSALRVSLGVGTTIEDINGFVRAYCKEGKKFMSRRSA